MSDSPFDWQRRLVFGPDGWPTAFLDFVPKSTFAKQYKYDPWDCLPVKPDVQVEMRIDLSNTMGMINVRALEVVQDEQITNVEVAGGYRWLKSDYPTISVPGVPDLLKSPEPFIGRLETDRHIKDAVDNVDYTGTSLLSRGVNPLEPIFHSLISPSLLDAIDIVVDRSVLVKLFRLSGVDTMYDEQDVYPFRIDAERIDNTVILHRWESAGDRWKSKPHITTAKAYIRAATHSSIPESDVNASCERVVRYEFGGMKMLVSFEVAAMVEMPVEVAGSEGLMDDKSEPTGSGVSDADWESDLQLDRDDSAVRDTIHSPHIKIVPSGYHHPAQSTLATVKSRSHLKQLDNGHVYGQLFFSQTPFLIIGRHDKFDYSVKEQEVIYLHGPEYAPIREQFQPNVDRVGAILREMVKRVKQRGKGDKGRVSFVCPAVGKMAVHERYGDVVQLSEEVKEMLWRAR